MKSFSTKGNVTERRKNALARLKKQLVDGVKTTNTATKNFAGIVTKSEVTVPLTEADRKRISSEIKILESRI